MARKKKSEDVSNPSGIDEIESSNFYGTLFTSEISTDPSNTETVVSEEVTDVVSNTAYISSEINFAEEIDIAMKFAQIQIDRCNAYIFSGRDLGLGRVFEASRREWCDYYVDLEYIKNHLDKSYPMPKEPEIQTVPE